MVGVRVGRPGGVTLPARSVLVCGPPCAGKTSWARRMAGPEDQVLDFDELARDLGSPRQWLHQPLYRTRAEQEMRRVMTALPGTGPDVIYVIRSLPRGQNRAITAKAIRAERCVVIDPGVDECLRRAVVDARPDGTDAEIRRWYAQYRPWSGDEHLTVRGV